MFNNLEKVLYEKKISYNRISKQLGVSEKIIKDKLSGRSEFTWGEIKKIMIIFPEYHIEYLFYTNKLEENIDLENEKKLVSM